MTNEKFHSFIPHLHTGSSGPHQAEEELQPALRGQLQPVLPPQGGHQTRVGVRYRNLHIRFIFQEMVGLWLYGLLRNKLRTITQNIVHTTFLMLDWKLGLACLTKCRQGRRKLCL